MQAAALQAVYIRFEPNPRQIVAWRARLLDRQADHNDPNPAEHYARAVPVLKSCFVRSTLQRAVYEDLPPGILCMFVGVAPDRLALALPAELSEFSNDEHRTLFEGIFQDPLLFRPYLHWQHGLVLEVTDDLSAAATNIFYLLQLLVPGMLLIVHDTFAFVNMAYHYHGTGGGHGGGTLPQAVLTRRTRRAMPPAQWIQNNAPVLENIFGQEYVQAFRECAVHRSHADWTTHS